MLVSALQKSYCWLVTGAAGFVGSNLAEYLLSQNQKVIGLDNFSFGKQQNIQSLLKNVSPTLQNNFQMVEGDIRDFSLCQKVCENVDFVIHHAAIASVEFSIQNPLETHAVNSTGFLNILNASAQSKAKKLVYASSSAVYGNCNQLPIDETQPTKPISIYAASKLCNELYAETFANLKKLNSVGLRYFNVFGQRQDPKGAYASVIPLWLEEAKHNRPLYINGDGTTTRDFCSVQDIIQANILAAFHTSPSAHVVYNVGLGQQTSLLQLATLIKETLQEITGKQCTSEFVHREFRQGDILHSCANIRKISDELKFQSIVNIKKALTNTIQWTLNS